MYGGYLEVILEWFFRVRDGDVMKVSKMVSIECFLV